MINPSDWVRACKRMPYTSPKFLDPMYPSEASMVSSTVLVWTHKQYHVAIYCESASGGWWVGDFGDMKVEPTDLWMPLPRVPIYCRG